MNTPINDMFLTAALGEHERITVVNKFGRNPSIDTTSDPEDVWDGGGTWVAPTEARIHNIASTSVNDTSDGSGARTIRVEGLLSWTEPEASETVTLNGTSDVATVGAYVIIHRMWVLTSGSGNTNAGNITATAVTDATVTAQISTGKGQTLMAIYGVPQYRGLYATQWYINWVRNVAAANSADCELLVCEDPVVNANLFLVKHHLGLFGSGNSDVRHSFRPYPKAFGPAIVKVRVENVSANGTDISAGFDGFLVKV